MINDNEHILECPRWGICSTPVYTGRCSAVCFALKSKYESTYNDKANIAYWEHRAAYNDFIWVECSNCKFRVENYKAVVLAGSDTKFSDTKYKYCPICGKEMRVH
jgi:hypothetical protein